MAKWFLLFFLLAGCKSLQQDRRCRMKPDRGPCDGAITVYYFDQEEQRCKPFTWGGCLGVVPFDFIEDCEACAETEN